MPAPSLRAAFGHLGPVPAKMEHAAIDAALTAPTSPFALEERVLPHNGVLTRTWKNLPRSTRDFFLMTAQVRARRGVGATHRAQAQVEVTTAGSEG